MSAGWDVVRMPDGGDVHVTPVNDTIEHTMTVQCVCRPFAEQQIMCRLIVHHSADGREHFEDDHDEDDALETVS